MCRQGGRDKGKRDRARGERPGIEGPNSTQKARLSPRIRYTLLEFNPFIHNRARPSPALFAFSLSAFTGAVCLPRAVRYRLFTDRPSLRGFRIPLRSNFAFLDRLSRDDNSRTHRVATLMGESNSVVTCTTREFARCDSFIYGFELARPSFVFENAWFP